MDKQKQFARFEKIMKECQDKINKRRAEQIKLSFYEFRDVPLDIIIKKVEIAEKEGFKRRMKVNKILEQINNMDDKKIESLLEFIKELNND